MYNILIADDESIVRRGIKTLVDYKALGIDEVFEAENGQTALDIIRSGTVHILVRPAAHVSNRCKSGIRPVVGRI